MSCLNSFVGRSMTDGTMYEFWVHIMYPEFSNCKEFFLDIILPFYVEQASVIPVSNNTIQIWIGSTPYFPSLKGFLMGHQNLS